MAADTIWLVGSPSTNPDTGVIYVWDGRELTLLRETAYPLTTIWVESAANMWVAGDNGAMHFDQTSWVDVPTSGRINSIWMRKPFDLCSMRIRWQLKSWQKV